MKTQKKLVPILLTFMLLISLMPTALAAESSYHDTNGHWAEAAIERWSDYGVIQGNNGSFNPNGSLTRAHMAAVLSRLLNLPDAPDAGFADVKAGDWHADYINRCAAAGIMLGTDGKANPNAPITRQQAIVMMARALGIKPVENPDLSHFQDGSKVSDYAKGYVAAMNEAGIVGGVTTDTLAGGSNITRAATVTILNRAITTYANEAGATVTATGSGIVLIAADNVTVTGKADSVLVAQGVSDGGVTLKDATVSGTVTVKAENATVAVAGESKVGEVAVAQDAAGTTVAVEKNAAVGTVTTEAPKSSVSVSGKVDTVTTTATAEKASVEVAKNATVGEIAASGEKTEIAVSGKVDSVTVADTAADTTVKANSGSTISKVDNAAEGTTVSGSGKVENVTTSGDNTTVSTPGTKVEASEGTSGTTAGGKDVAGGSSSTTQPSTPSGGGGGGGSSSSSSHSHTYSETWEKDETFHWHEATCGHDVVSAKAEHTYVNYVCTVCGAMQPEAQAAEEAWDALNTALDEIKGNDGAALVVAGRNGNAYTLTLNVDAIQSGSAAVDNSVLDGLATKLKEALDAKFGTFALTVDGQEVYDKGDFKNTALKNALFSVADGFFYTLSNMTDNEGIYTYKTVNATVSGDGGKTYAFTIAVQLKGGDVEKVQRLAGKLADHLQMEKLTSAQITSRYGITVAESEAVVVTVEMPDALMEKAAQAASNMDVQNQFDTHTVGTFLTIMSGLNLNDVLGSGASEVNSVLATVNSNANAVNKVLSKLDVKVTAKDGTEASFNKTFTPGTEGDAWHNFMTGVIGMTENGIASMKPSQFKVSQEGTYKDVYYAVPVTVQIDLESSMGFQATETVVVVLHVDFSQYTAPETPAAPAAE